MQSQIPQPTQFRRTASPPPTPPKQPQTNDYERQTASDFKKPPVVPRRSHDHTDRHVAGGLRRVSALTHSDNSQARSSPLVMRFAKNKQGLERFSPHVISMYRQIFDQIDVTGRGKVSLAELSSALSTLSRDHVIRMMKKGDHDKDGKLSFEEFVDVMSHPDTDLGDSPEVAHVSAELLREYRKMFNQMINSRPNRSKNPNLQIDDLARGLGISFQRSKQLFRHAWVDEDGLSFEAFVELVTNEQTDLNDEPPKPPQHHNTNNTSNTLTIAKTLDFGDFDDSDNESGINEDELRRPSVLEEQRRVSIQEVDNLLDRSAQWSRTVADAMRKKREALEIAKQQSPRTKQEAEDDEKRVANLLPHIRLNEIQQVFTDLQIDKNGVVEPEQLTKSFEDALDSTREMVKRLHQASNSFFAEQPLTKNETQGLTSGQTKPAPMNDKQNYHDAALIEDIRQRIQRIKVMSTTLRETVVDGVVMRN